MADYPHLFTPITLAGHRLKNRIVFGAHTTNMGEDGCQRRSKFSPKGGVKLYHLM